MFIFFIGLVSGLTSLFFLMLYKYSDPELRSTDSIVASKVFLIIFLLVSFASIFATVDYYVSQRKDFEELKKVENVEIIYKKKAVVLTESFTAHLSGAYPDFEKGIFEEIKPNNVSVYLVKYPELKSSQTLMLLVEKINKLQDDRYDQQINKEKILKRLRFRTKNIWFWTYFIPNINELQK